MENPICLFRVLGHRTNVCQAVRVRPSLNKEKVVIRFVLRGAAFWAWAWAWAWMRVWSWTGAGHGDIGTEAAVRTTDTTCDVDTISVLGAGWPVLAVSALLGAHQEDGKGQQQQRGEHYVRNQVRHTRLIPRYY